MWTPPFFLSLHLAGCRIPEDVARLYFRDMAKVGMGLGSPGLVRWQSGVYVVPVARLYFREMAKVGARPRASWVGEVADRGHSVVPVASPSGPGGQIR